MPSENNKPVLVADDLAAGGAEAIHQGQKLAAELGAPLIVVHAIPDMGPLEQFLSSLDDAGQREISALEQRAEVALRSRLERLADGVDAEVRVAIGSPHRVVLKAADEVSAGWVVAGASSADAVERFFLGSSAAQIVRHAPCPVLIARPSPKDGLVLVATDLSDVALPALEHAVERSKHLDAELVVLHALDLAHPLVSSIEPAVVIDEEAAGHLRDTAKEILGAALERFGAKGNVQVVEGSPKAFAGMTDLVKYPIKPGRASPPARV